MSFCDRQNHTFFYSAGGDIVFHQNLGGVDVKFFGDAAQGVAFFDDIKREIIFLHFSPLFFFIVLFSRKFNTFKLEAA